MDGWKTSFLLGWPIFRGYVSFRECILSKKVQRDSDDRGICLGWSTNRLRFTLPTHLLGNAPPRTPETKFQFGIFSRSNLWKISFSRIVLKITCKFLDFFYKKDTQKKTATKNLGKSQRQDSPSCLPLQSVLSLKKKTFVSLGTCCLHPNGKTNFIENRNTQIFRRPFFQEWTKKLVGGFNPSEKYTHQIGSTDSDSYIYERFVIHIFGNRSFKFENVLSSLLGIFSSMVVMCKTNSIVSLNKLHMIENFELKRLSDSFILCDCFMLPKGGLLSHQNKGTLLWVLC